jgi:hypothetical protein
MFHIAVQQCKTACKKTPVDVHGFPCDSCLMVAVSVQTTDSELPLTAARHDIHSSRMLTVLFAHQLGLICHMS